MKIGATDLNGSGNSSFKKTNFLDVEANKANVYRVFPPLFSLADAGAMTYFHKTHTIWLTSKTGKQYPQTFKCLQRKKDKVVTHECPFCTLAEKYQATYDAGKKILDGMPESESKEVQKKQLNEFLKTKIWSTQSKGNNYLNVVGLEGKIGVLRISYKQYEALKARVADLATNWKTDATGMTGVFLNFTKASPYKGSKDVTFAVDAWMESVVGPNGMPQMSFKYHQLTPEVIAQMTKDCEDLRLLYSDISFEDAAELVSKFEDKEALKLAAERIFTKAAPAPAEVTVPAAPVAPQVSAPQVAVTPQPFVPAPIMQTVVPAAPAPMPVTPTAFAPPPLAAPAPGGIFGAAALPQGGLSNVSEDEFAKLFG